MMTLAEFARLVADMRRLQVKVRRMGSGFYVYAETNDRDMRSLEKIERDVDVAIDMILNEQG